MRRCRRTCDGFPPKIKNLLRSRNRKRPKMREGSVGRSIRAPEKEDSTVAPFLSSFNSKGEKEKENEAAFFYFTPPMRRQRRRE